MKRLLYTTVCLLVCMVLPIPTFAAGNSAGFAVSAVPPANQTDKNTSHFDLLVQPGQSQELVVHIENNEAEEIVLTIETIAASTDRNGNILYSAPGIYDSSMRFPFSTLAVPAQKEIIIPANGTVDAVIALTMPDEEFDGIVLGAIRVLRQPDMEETQGTGIVNQYSYVIGVRLTELTETIEPCFALGNVHADLVNHKAAIIAEIRNTEAAIAKEVSVHAQIYSWDSDIPMIEKAQEKISIAPNSVFPFSLIDQEGYGFPEGEYLSVVRLAYNGEETEFRQNFHIQKETADDINKNAVNQVQNRSKPGRDFPWAVLIAAIALVAALFRWRYVVLRKRRTPESASAICSIIAETNSEKGSRT